MAVDKHGSIRHFSLMNSLLAVLSTCDHDSTDCVLASYFLDHFDSLADLNVYDVAEECFTSRSGIRRFCQSIGLENFSDLKSYVWEWEEHRDLFVSYTDHPDYANYLEDSIASMMATVRRATTGPVLDDLAVLLHDAGQVVILTSDFSSMAVRQFQQSMFYLHKVVHLITDSTGDVARIASPGYDDALIVLSEHGGYAEAVLPVIGGTKVPRALVTLDCPDDVARSFELVVRLSDGPVRPGRGVFASYGITFFLDLLYNRYFVLFEQGRLA